MLGKYDSDIVKFIKIKLKIQLCNTKVVWFFVKIFFQFSLTHSNSWLHV